MVSYVRGIETPIAGVLSSQRPRRFDPGIVIPLSPAECDFLLIRTANISETAEALVHRPQTHTLRLKWERRFVVTRLLAINDLLRSHHDTFHVHTALDRAILVEAIEGNPYFALMDDDDPRLTVEAVKSANALREKIATALHQTIARVPLGVGRKRLPVKVSNVKATRRRTEDHIRNRPSVVPA